MRWCRFVRRFTRWKGSSQISISLPKMPPEEAVRSALPKPCLSQPPLEGRPLTLRIQTFDAMRSVSSAATPLSRVRKYIRHKCKAKRRRDNKAREFYRKERCAQLRSHANQKLNAMLAQQESLSKGREITGSDHLQRMGARVQTNLSNLDAWRQ
jgi:hypothetical protein